MSISNNKAGSGKGLFLITEKNFDVTTDPNIAINFSDYTPTINGTAIKGLEVSVEGEIFKIKVGTY